jgi:class 3 adenylate cyclase/tetratricopeptide (TPR) repeat protein
MAACPRCEEENLDRARFCHACGLELTAPATGREEREPVSVLFVDLVGSTGWTERSDPEDVRAAMLVYFDRVRHELERLGGTVAPFTGDAILGVFGSPQAHGDDAERAVRAGLQALAAIDELNRDQPDRDLAVRAAADTGEVVVSVDARPELGENLATGDAVNTASRLLQAAPRGRLVVGPQTYRATRRAIRYEALPPVSARGKSLPDDAWLAVEPILELDDRSADRTQMVGRDREASLVASIWERAVSARRPHLVTVVGPPGIGKTRLALEVAAGIAGGGARVTRGRCLPAAVRAPYQAFGQQVKDLAGVLETDGPAVARGKLDRMAAELVPGDEAAAFARYLALLTGIGPESPADRRGTLFFAARRLLERLAADRPLLLVFEDAHWADTSELDLIGYLVSQVRDAPVMFLVLTRPDLFHVRHGWGSGPLAQTTVPLEPLAEDDSRLLADQLLSAAPDQRGAVTQLVSVAQGDPLFIEELAASLSEGGSGAGRAFPRTVSETIAGRLDSLPAPARAALMAAAVVGTTFRRGAVAAVGGEASIDEALGFLEIRDLIGREERSPVAGGVEFTFKHVLTREVAYGALPRTERRERHAAAARYVEQATGERAAEVARTLAHHWREAGVHALAVDHLLVAAERARDRWAVDEAVRLYGEALDLVDDEDRRRAILIARATTQVERGDYARGAIEIDELLPRLGGREELEALHVRARAAIRNDDPDHARGFSELLAVRAEQVGAPEMLAPALGYQSVALAMRGDEGDIDRAREIGDRAIGSWPEGARPSDLGSHLEMQAVQRYWTGRYDEALQLAQTAVRLAEETHDPEPLLRGGAYEVLALTGLGRHEEALSVADATVVRARKLGLPFWLAVNLNVSTAALRDVFDLDEARRRSLEATELALEVGFEFGEIQAGIDLLYVDLAMQDIGAAERGWKALWDRANEARGWHRWLTVGRLAAARAEIAAHTDGPVAAIEHAREAIRLADIVERGAYATAARTTLGAALLTGGRRGDAVAELRSAVAAADGLGTPPARWRTRAALTEALATTGDDEGADATTREAAAIAGAFGSTLSDEHARSLLAAPPIVAILRTSG